MDQELVLPTPEEEEEEEEEEASVTPELTMTDRLLQLLDKQKEEDIIRRMKKRVQDLVIPEWKVKLVQSYNWP